MKGGSGVPQLPFLPNWGISIKHYLNQVKVLSKREIYVGVSKNLLEFWKNYLKKKLLGVQRTTPSSVNKGLNVEPSNSVFLKTCTTEFDDIIITFTDQNGRPPKPNSTLLIINRNDTLLYRKSSKDMDFCHLQEIYA